MGEGLSLNAKAGASPSKVRQGGIPTDSMLIERTLSGDSGAFEALMERYRPLVLGCLHSKAFSNETVEELAQQAFYAAYARLGSLRRHDRFGPWLKAIALNELRGFWRKQGAERRGAGREVPMDAASEDAAGQFADASPNPMDEASFAETEKLVLDAIAEMGEKYRVVLHMRLIGEQSPKEIAHLLGVGEGAVRARLFRGLRNLRRTLTKKGLDSHEV